MPYSAHCLNCGDPLPERLRGSGYCNSYCWDQATGDSTGETEPNDEAYDDDYSEAQEMLAEMHSGSDDDYGEER